MGFRCCPEAGDGATTEPLTPFQKAKGWDMKRVERTAGMSVEEMRELLEKKKTDPSCGGDEWSLPERKKGSLADPQIGE